MLQWPGMSSEASAAYHALIARPGSTAATLAQSANLTQDQVSVAVAELRQLGLLRHDLLGSCELRLVDPERALALLLRRREAEITRQQRDLEEARAAAASVIAVHWAYQAEDGSSSQIGSQQQALAQARELLGGATARCLLAIPDPGAILESGGHPVPDLVADGVQVAVLCADAARGDVRTTTPYLLAKAGAQVRTTPLVTMPLLACGAPPRTALMWSGPDQQEAVLVRDHAVATMLTRVFESLWDVATPLEDEPWIDPRTGLAPSDRALLSLLAAGLTNQAAARRLGISLRTFNRQRARLMQTLEVTSSFQAGCAATRRGWI